MIAGLTIRALIGSLGGVAQALAMLTFVMYKLESLIVATRQAIQAARVKTATTQAAAKVAAIDIEIEKAVAAVLSADADVAAAERRQKLALAKQQATYETGTANKVAIVEALKEIAP